jgi:hypothetical protein
MNTIVKAGVLLGLLCCAWTFVMGFTGWYKDPALLNLFFLVIVIEIAVLAWALRMTAAEGRGYGGQVVAGTLISLIGGAIIFAGSLLLTMVAFPQYFTEIAAVQEQQLSAAGQSEEQIRAFMNASAPGRTPVAQAIAGFLGTVVTGVVVSAILAIFMRARKPAAA